MADKIATVEERRYFVTYREVVAGQTMHAIIYDDGRMDWSKHPGWANRIEIPQKYWSVSITDMIAFFNSPKPKVRIPHG